MSRSSRRHTSSWRPARKASATCALVSAAWLLAAPRPVLAQHTTTRVSVGPGGVQGSGESSHPTISADGRWVAFWSNAANLTSDDANGGADVFVRDLQAGTTTRVSIGHTGASASGGAHAYPAISADGRWVAFWSPANDIVPADTNARSDVFVRDMQAGFTSRVSLGPGGVQGNSDSMYPSLSADGRFVAFWSTASNLVPGDTNALSDVFVHDRLTGETTRVSVGTGGTQATGGASAYGAISADGRYVAFHSWASLVPGAPTFDAQVYVHDRQESVTTRESVSTGGAPGSGDSLNPTISEDGRWVTFHSWASNLVAVDTNTAADVFVRDRLTGVTALVSAGPGGVQGNSSSTYPVITPDGRRITFSSTAVNLVPGDTNGRQDVFVYDRQRATTSRVSIGSGATQGNGHSFFSGLSADGRWAVFGSLASNLAPGDTNGVSDVFVHDLGDDVSPSGLRVHAVVGNMVTLRWNLPGTSDPPTGFVLEGGINPGEVLASLPTGSTDPTFTFTAPTGSFYVRVHAVNGTVRSAASNEIRIHVNVPVSPSAPANLLGLVNGSTVALAWTNTYAGGTPTSLVLDVTGAIVTSLPLGLADSFSVAGVPPGTYTLALRARNASGTSPPSSAVTLTFPGPCSGPPLTPTNVLAYRSGNTVFVDWAPAASGPAPTGYVLDVTGSFVGSFPTAARAMSGTVGPGSYILSVVATNPCGASGGTDPQTIVVP